MFRKPGNLLTITTQVINFLLRFASQIDLDANIDVPVVDHDTKPSLEQALPNAAEPGTAINYHRSSEFVRGPKLEFEPLRRKLNRRGSL